MAKKVKNILKNNMVLCVLILVAIGLASFVFAADFKIKEGAIKEGIVFGSWKTTDSNSTTLSQDNVYKAESDGFVCVHTDSLNSDGGHIAGFTDGSNPPATLRSYCVTGAVYGAHPVLNFTMPVKKGDYWKVTESGNGTPTILWIPIGNGDCVKQ